jgi:fatty acid synthase, bacterial type (EC 2.3.1.-)
VANIAGEDALNEWRDRANARLAAGQRRLEEGMMGRAALYEPIDNRRFHEDGRGYDAHEVEKAMLLRSRTRALRPLAISKRETATSKSVLNMGK